MFTLLACVRLQNVFSLQPHFKCSQFPNLKISFPEIGADGHTLQQPDNDIIQFGGYYFNNVKQLRLP
jgi:hypothetical protein